MRRLAALGYLGTAGIVLGLQKVHASAIGHYDLTGSSRFGWSLAFIAVLCLASYGVGLSEQRTARGAAAVGAKAASLGAIGISLAQLAAGSALLPRFVVLLTPVLLVAWYVACILAIQASRQNDSPRARAVAVLRPEEAAMLSDDLDGDPNAAAVAVVVFDIDQATAHSAGPGPLIEAAGEQRIAMLVLSQAALLNESVLRQAAELHAAGIRVRTLSDFYEECLGKLPLAELGRASLLFDIGELHDLRYTRAKRVVDTVIGLVGSVVLVALLPLVLLGNLIANRGRLFYSQPRVGKNGALFSMLKFRTMRPGAEVGEWTAEGDARVTPFGRWMRRTHLDELPQVVNILRGDLATVGPRPEQPHYVAELTAKIAFYELRHLVRPGLTGWAQVNYRYGASELDALEKLQYEFYYLRHGGLALDARIIVRTLRSVLGATGR